MRHTLRILLTAPDRPGLIADCSQAVRDLGGNIIDLDQHSSHTQLHMRMVVEYPSGEGQPKAFEWKALGAELEQSLPAQVELTWPRPRRCVVFCSKHPHCLADLLWRAEVEDLGVEITRVVANDPAAERWAERFGVPFELVPFAGSSDREAAEARQLEILRSEQAELLVLARYMRILSAEMLEQLQAIGCAAINIHHSPLPAFVGANPHRRAWERGVKVIGATAHYVTEDLDEGPIIAQEVREVSHRDELSDIVRISRDTERLALASAVRAHAHSRVITASGRTIVF